VCFGFFSVVSCQKEAETPTEVTEEEISTSVPALSDLHEVVYPLWHDAFPEKDYDLIKELLLQLDSLTQELDQAELPGILRDKQSKWDEGKQALKSSLEKLHQAAEADDREEMLSQTEAFHAGFERLVRTIRPVVPELEAFHQELYKLYHYYLPNYELEKIQSAVAAMLEKIGPLKAAQLSARLSSRQGDFQAAVETLETELNELAEIVKTGKKKEISSAVEKVHTAYQNTERIFD
ncbi:MAG: hypothetical protein PVF22_08150, partial [Candidatus Aminicenantes bacterium]